MQRSEGRKAKEVVHWQPTEAVKQKAPALTSYCLASRTTAAGAFHTKGHPPPSCFNFFLKDIHGATAGPYFVSAWF